MAVRAGTFTLDPDTGRLLIRTSRTGLAARAGHDLLIEVTRWSARVEVPESGDPAGATITAEIDLSSLAVREGTGGVKPLTDADRADIHRTVRKILPRDGTVARFRSSRVIATAGGGAIEGSVELNGKSQPVRLQLTELTPARYQGSAT
ncbi:MAG TPA: YceI family protein, partial [Streptosporangiaceae bacterium]|nr:YceI family protein [Streptosporangiaceae bacterium]